MYRILSLLLLMLCLTQACKIHSTTYIDPEKSFVLGEGTHSKYKAEVKNIGNTVIEVINVEEGGNEALLTVLKAGDKGIYAVKKNATVIFKNKSVEKTGTIQIKISGDSNLSMDYK
jgi:hypothetical protein